MKKYRIPLPPMPQNKYQIRLEPAGMVFEVDPALLPYSRHGLPGSILDVISAKDESLIDHACGGVQACSTCHVYIETGLETCSEISEREEDHLDQAVGVKLESRLACCCVPNGKEKLVVVRVPQWQKNEVKEG